MQLSGHHSQQTLRESALQMVRFLQAPVFEFRMRDDVKIISLMTRLTGSVRAHGNHEGPTHPKWYPLLSWSRGLYDRP